MRARSFLRGMTPPYVASAVRKVRARGHARPHGWEHVGSEWVDDPGAGWDAETVGADYAQKLDSFRRAIATPNPIGVPTEARSGCTPTQYDQNVALGYAYAVARAASGRRATSILDWGGGFGFMALIARELFPGLDIDFHVKEVPVTAAAARSLVGGVTFWDDDSCLDRPYDLVTACSSLQYFSDWRSTLGRVAAAGTFLYLTRTPVAITPSSYVVRQHAYGTSYSGWVFSRDELLSAAGAVGLVLDREFLEGYSADVPGAPAREEARGFLFTTGASRTPA